MHPLSVDEHLDCSCLLAVVKKAAGTWVYKYLFETPLSVLLNIYPEMELWDDWVIPVINWGTAILFPITAASFYIRTSSAQGF